MNLLTELKNFFLEYVEELLNLVVRFGMIDPAYYQSYLLLYQELFRLS